jgi:hypothetical protein
VAGEPIVADRDSGLPAMIGTHSAKRMTTERDGRSET